MGLGNPGPRYTKTRHNLGFCVIGQLAKDWHLSLKSVGQNPWAVAHYSSGTSTVSLLTPLTFMNHSGMAVKALVRQKGYSPSDILVICDDLSLPFGSLRLRAKGSAGGHKGLLSIISELQSDGFHRLRMGIGHPGSGRDVPDYVLEKFHPQEFEGMNEFVGRAVECCSLWSSDGIEKAMEIFNRSTSDENS